jgi:hypothetical protein
MPELEMGIYSTPISIISLIKDAFRIFLKKPGYFFVISIISIFPGLLIRLFIPLMNIYNEYGRWGYNLATGIMNAVSAVFNWIFALFIVIEVSNIITGRDLSYHEVFHQAKRRFFPTIRTMLLAMIFILFMFCLLIIPGLIVTTQLLFTPEYVILREVSGSKALQESEKLVKGRGWQVFWLWLIPNGVMEILFRQVNGLIHKTTPLLNLLSPVTIALSGVIFVLLMIYITILFFKLERLQQEKELITDGHTDPVPTNL